MALLPLAQMVLRNTFGAPRTFLFAALGLPEGIDFAFILC